MDQNPLQSHVPAMRQPEHLLGHFGQGIVRDPDLGRITR
jgi:hypothetical protein